MARLRTIPAWAAALALVLVVGAVLRVQHAVDHGAFLSTDERAYAKLGLAISRGAYQAPGMDDPLHWPPGTPLLFAVAREVGGGAPGNLDPMSAYWAQAIVGVALIAVVFLLARTVGGRWAGVAAAAAVALYPPLQAVTGDMVSEPLGALAMALFLLALAWAWRRPSALRFALAGALTGAAILVRADLLVLPAVLTVVVALSLRRSGGRRALALAGAYLAAAVLAIAPWSVYASNRRGQLTPVTTSSWSSLYVGTYLPADGKISGIRRELGSLARRHNPRLRGIRDQNMRVEWILDAVAARHREIGRSRALREETIANLRRYALGSPLAFAGMQLGKLQRMWIGYNRGTHHNARTWVLVLHVTLAAIAFAGLLLGLWRTRDPVLWAILATVAVGTAVNAFFVSEARHNARFMPLLVAGGAAGFAQLLSRRSPAARTGPPPTAASARPPDRGGRPQDAAGAR